MSDSRPERGETVLIPGARDVRGTLDGPDDPNAIVVACPPHPQHGGSRTDARLQAVGEALASRGVGCLRIDYGPWDEGRGERTDVLNAIRWADDHAETVAVFGFSFGASEAILATAATDRDVSAVSALAPATSLGPDLNAVSAIGDLDANTALQIVYGTRDETADWEPVSDRARERGAEVVEWSADHFFVGQERKIATDVADFVEANL